MILLFVFNFFHRVLVEETITKSHNKHKFLLQEKNCGLAPEIMSSMSINMSVQFLILSFVLQIVVKSL